MSEHQSTTTGAKPMVDEDAYNSKIPWYTQEEDLVFRTGKVALVSGAWGGLLGSVMAYWRENPQISKTKAGLVGAMGESLSIVGSRALLFAAVGATYEGSKGIAKSVRGVDDWKNGAIGGCAAGGLLGGVLGRNMATAFIGCGVFGGAIGFSTGAFSTMSPRPREYLYLNAKDEKQMSDILQLGDSLESANKLREKNDEAFNSVSHEDLQPEGGNLFSIEEIKTRSRLYADLTKRTRGE